TLDQGFDFRYLILPGGAIQPFFLLDQDLIEAAGGVVRSLVQGVRRFWPRLLKMRTLMVGCAAGEGHLVAEGAAGELAAALPKLAREHKARLMVMKEFPARYREALATLRRHGF